MTKNVIINCDVTFAEDEEWKWNATAETDLKKTIYLRFEG